MSGEMVLRIFDVEHGACALIVGPNQATALIDCGHNSTTGFRPSRYLRHQLGLTNLNYLLVSNADRDHVSDADGFLREGVHVEALIRACTLPAAELRRTKEAEGPLSAGMKAYINMHATYWGAFTPFDAGMGGVKCKTFCNLPSDLPPGSVTTNNLSMVTFIEYLGVKFLFPGDLEGPGWRALLKREDFRAALKYTDVLVASHHGRWTGFCDEIFEHFRPQVVVISDDGIQYESQETVPDYRDVLVSDAGVPVTCGAEMRQRHVLTTRSDGDIIFSVKADGFRVWTTRSRHKQAA